MFKILTIVCLYFNTKFHKSSWEYVLFSAFFGTKGLLHFQFMLWTQISVSFTLRIKLQTRFLFLQIYTLKSNNLVTVI